MGCIGSPMTDYNKERYISAHSYNQDPEVAATIRAASADTFGFDCVCLIKSVLWGWNGNKDMVYGGAYYASNGVPDIDAGQMINVCYEQSTNFNYIEVGEAVYMPGHIGVYIGNGLAVECTPKWNNCVQITACNCTIDGYNRRNWTKHGKLPYITYEEVLPPVETKPTESTSVSLPVLKRGHICESVKALQIILIGYGYAIASGADGNFGASTENAVKALQKDKGLPDTGVVDKKTWIKLLGVE